MHEHEVFLFFNQESPFYDGKTNLLDCGEIKKNKNIVTIKMFFLTILNNTAKSNMFPKP
jgi:hypothetical protein